MKRIIFLVFCLILINRSSAQSPALVGYWHNWNSTAPYIQLDQVDNRYNVIEIAFAVPVSANDMTMVFTPDMVSQSTFISQIQTLKNQGKKVLISIGGATAVIDLTTVINKNAFITSMTNIINTYGFDGIDIDIEHGNSIMISGGATISNPAGNPAMANLIDAIKQIMVNFRSNHSNKMMLTMAPETAYVQGGQSGFGNIWGGYLPIIHALRDSLDIIQVQLYNSGTMYGINGSIYAQGTADFIVAMTEAVVHGFNTSGGYFTGLPASKVAVGLPACPSAAGGGYTHPDTVKAAIKYLLGTGPKPGTYSLVQSGGYPSLRGMMTWSVNWDAYSGCGSVYEYASNFQSIFLSATDISNDGSQDQSTYVTMSDDGNELQLHFEHTGEFKVEIFNASGKLVYNGIDEQSLDITDFSPGMYVVSVSCKDVRAVRKFIKPIR